MNTKQRKTLQAIFTKPTSSSIVFSDIEALIIGLGGEVHEREGSRVKILLKGEQWRCHRPHPGKRGQALPSRRGPRIAGTSRSKTMNTMTHKGYTARIEFDERDNIFVGRVLGLRVMISFHGETVAELHEAFAGAIEDFLSDCRGGK
ncbi:type II toxin-antitoxin system HicB family antitoxin [Aromatoleum anaerobium]|uniref:type II toxin-antitoxin system HicB family antitoxin n=1 Tax=Aromatoleum anaerobium TaxID=182180 RepID=UPI001B7D01DD|nr:type II toxin-antitoxin system HicB family antitoxin [Aromatoleum anaerobium]MCK0505851.1 type II toxin-antitoxin system HicB family antitoxin [Aromatoleum anaerobium]